MRGYLVADSGQGSGRRVPIGHAIVLGRTPDNGFVIEDSGASRRHVEIRFADGSYFWEDLGSTNGTYINDQPLREGQLKHGDRIRIGNTTVVFELEEDAPPARSSDTTATRFRQTILDEHGKETTPLEPTDTDRLLDAVYSVMNEIASNYEPCSLLDRVLKTILRAADAQRCAILFAEAPGQPLQPCPVCRHVHMIRDGILAHARVSDIQISTTIAERVLEGGESVLYKDTATHQDFNPSESMVTMNLRSVICVPLRGKNGIFGVLYMDSDRPASHYSHEHMLLATAVGNSAGLALENARMHNEILEKQRFEQELAYAASIQEGFLERDWPAGDERFDVYGEARPAKAVGGDFYDVVQLSRDQVGILVGDVSGKGIPAALAMAQLLAVFRAETKHENDPLEVVSAMNQSLVNRSQRGMFCTVSFLTVDLSTGIARCVNAGHHPTLHLSRIDVDEVAPASGVPIGILGDATWSVAELRLGKGDSVLLYTDGIVEARAGASAALMTGAQDEYGLDNLKFLAQGLYNQPARILVEEINKDVRRHALPDVPHDDCTLIALRFLG